MISDSLSVNVKKLLYNKTFNPPPTLVALPIICERPLGPNITLHKQGSHGHGKVMEIAKSWKKSNGNWHEAQRLWNIDHVAQIGTALLQPQLLCMHY